jgi:methionyl-tRNA formyltransferase
VTVLYEAVTQLSVYVHPADGGGPLHGAVCDAIRGGCHTITADPIGAHVAIAPLLRRVLAPAEYAAPVHGTLIFHPSLLPRRRGPDAVRWAVADGDPYTGVTWFWCADGLDAGDVCEQDLVAVPAGWTAGRLYRERLVPAGVRALVRALAAIAAGVPRRVAQDETAATYQSWHPSRRGLGLS